MVRLLRPERRSGCARPEAEGRGGAPHPWAPISPPTPTVADA